jgi:hypothetical protein
VWAATENGKDDSAGTNLYNWCLSLLRIREPAAAAEVDRLQADSKFFRSLTLAMVSAAVLVLLVAIWGLIGGAALKWCCPDADKAKALPGLQVVVAGMVAPATAWFSLKRYCKLRWDATERVYAYFLLFERYPRLRKSGTASDSGGSNIDGDVEKPEGTG